MEAENAGEGAAHAGRQIQKSYRPGMGSSLILFAFLKATRQGSSLLSCVIRITLSRCRRSSSAMNGMTFFAFQERVPGRMASILRAGSAR